MKQLLSLLILGVLIAFTNSCTKSESPQVPETNVLTGVDLDAINKKVAELVDQMTLDEKMLFMHGNKEGLKYDGPPPIPRLGIPSYVIAHARKAPIPLDELSSFSLPLAGSCDGWQHALL